MCTYRTEVVEVAGSGKGPAGFPVTDASVYLDHPVDAPADHTLNVDVRNPARGAAARVALGLDPAAARTLAETIRRVLDEAPPGLVEPGRHPARTATRPRTEARPAPRVPTDLIPPADSRPQVNGVLSSIFEDNTPRTAT